MASVPAGDDDTEESSAVAVPETVAVDIVEDRAEVVAAAVAVVFSVVGTAVDCTEVRCRGCCRMEEADSLHHRKEM